jgi:hypothetical protein
VNGKSDNMSVDFAIKVLASTKVNVKDVPGSRVGGRQTQTHYDIARQMAIKALRHMAECESCAEKHFEVKNEK